MRRSPAETPSTSTPRRAATRSSSPSCSRAGTTDDLPPSVANAVLGRAARLDDDARRLVELVSVVPRRVPHVDRSTPCCPAGRSPPRSRSGGSCSRSTRPTFASGTSSRRNAISVEPADGRPPAAPRRDPRRPCWRPRPTRPRSSTTPRRRARTTSSPTMRWSRRDGPRPSTRTARRSRTTAVRPTSSTGSRSPIRRPCSRSSRSSPTSSPGSTTPLPRSSARSRSTPSLGDEEASAGARAPSRGCAGTRATAPPPGAPRSRRSRSSSRSASRSSSPAPTAASPSSRCSPRIRGGARVGREGARARHPARRRQRRARTRSSTSAARRSTSITATRRPLLEAHAVADAAGDRHEAVRALINLGYSLMCWVQPDASRRTPSAPSPTPRSTRCTRSRRTPPLTLAWLRLRAGDWDEAESVSQARARAGRHRLPAAREDRARRARRSAGRSGRGRAARRPCRPGPPRGRAAAQVPVIELTSERALTAGAPMPTERIRRSIEDVQARGRLVGWGSLRRRRLGRGGGHRRSRSTGRTRRSTRRCSARDWLGAADAFGAVGWTYDRALMLSLLDDEQSLVEAIEIAREPRGRAADAPRGPTPARARAERPARAAGGDAGEPGRPHCPRSSRCSRSSRAA